MKIYNDTNLADFEFWAGAKYNAGRLTIEELEQAEFYLEELHPQAVSETMVNDLFWFDFETICDWLGLDMEEVLLRQRRE